jgi:glyoxylase I family protein
MAINTTSVAHIRLTVTDIKRSRHFYESVFNWPINLEVPENCDDATRERLAFLFGGVIYNVGDSRVGLRPGSNERFNEHCTGLDHIAFRVTSKAELDDAARHLDDLGIVHEPIKDIGVMYILEFRDPDNIALEITAPK